MRWLIKRVGVALATIVTAITIAFVLIRLLPGNPVDAYIAELLSKYGGTMSYDEILARAKAVFAFMPKGPLHVQYFDFLKNVFLLPFGMGSLGKSLTYAPGVPVEELIARSVVWTVFVLSIALTISFAGGIAIGMFLAYKRGTKFEGAATLFLTMLRSIPDYIVASILIIVFAVYAGIFPIGGNVSAEGLKALEQGDVLTFIADVMYHATLPIISYIIVSLPFWALSMRASTISVLGEDFVTVAEARGLPSRRIAMTYVGRNAILPLFTQFMLALGGIFGGAVFIEYLFNYPGMGLLIVNALQRRDYTLLQGCFLVTVTAVVLGAFMADLLYAFLDPRVRRGRA